MWECRDEFLLGGGGGEENVKPGKSVYINFFFLKMSESVILTRNGTDKTLDLSVDLMTKKITSLESSREI